MASSEVAPPARAQRGQGGAEGEGATTASGSHVKLDRVYVRAFRARRKVVGSEGEGTGEDGDQEQVDGEKGKGDGRGGEDRVESVRESSGMVKKDSRKTEGAWRRKLVFSRGHQSWAPKAYPVLCLPTLDLARLHSRSGAIELSHSFRIYSHFVTA